MNEREIIAWLYRRAGFGLGPGELDAMEVIGVDGVIDRLADGDAHGISANPDPWAEVVLHDYELEEFRREDRIAIVGAWLRHMLVTPRPAEERMRWFWHGHLVSGLQDVTFPGLMIAQLRLYGDLGLGDFGALLRATTVDSAMLLYLDGVGSSAGAPNENYGRELLELFALGIGTYTETDIQQAAAALTGWRVNRQTGVAFLDPRIHDDTRRTFLGVAGVHDVDSVVDAVVGHDACAPWIAGRLTRAVLGGDVAPSVVDEMATIFRNEGLVLRPLLRAILVAGAEGRGGTMIQRPVPWLIGAIRATGSATLTAAIDSRDAGGRNADQTPIGRLLQAMGQVPCFPPNVSGWPGDTAWLGSSVTVARFNAAALIAEGAPEDGAARLQAAGKDWGALADTLGRPAGFAPTTRQALDQASSAGGPPGVAALTVALASPEMIQS